MAFDFHKDKLTYIQYQEENALRFVIPFIEEKIAVEPGIHVMEIGCAEGGVLKAFISKGCIGTGVELQEGRYERAKELLKEPLEKGNAFLVNKDIYEVDIDTEMPHRFDLIVLKDVIEHIYDQDKIMGKFKDFLKPGGCIFFGFPPWQMPFGGHQQIAKNKWASKLPYYHLLPRPLYRMILKAFGESEKTIEELMEIKDTGISIERFERLVKKHDYQVLNRKYYLINPIYEYKFNWRVKEQSTWLSKLPFIRNYFTTCMYYLIQK